MTSSTGITSRLVLSFHAAYRNKKRLIDWAFDSALLSMCVPWDRASLGGGDTEFLHSKTETVRYWLCRSIIVLDSRPGCEDIAQIPFQIPKYWCCCMFNQCFRPESLNSGLGGRTYLMLQRWISIRCQGHEYMKFFPKAAWRLFCPSASLLDREQRNFMQLTTSQQYLFDCVYLLRWPSCPHILHRSTYLCNNSSRGDQIIEKLK